MEKYYGNKTLEELVKEESMPGYMFVEDEDLVYVEEQNRLNTLDDTSKSYNNSSAGIILNTSNEFKVYKKTLNRDEGIYSVRFISIGEKYPNSELREYISCGIWADDYNFVYAVKGRGIFVYNVKERIYKTIITGSAEYKLEVLIDNKLYYDGSEYIELNLQ